jgi:O-antigen ligase
LIMEKFLLWWERGLISALGLSIALLGIGRLEFGRAGMSVSAWSVSRTTFFFWLILKLVQLARDGRTSARFSDLKPLAPLLVFFSVVTLSLLPDFRQPGDYRYFFFACAHALMLVDLFPATRAKRWLPVMLGVLPIVLVLRGVADNPAVLSFSLTQRFAFPLDHPNTAGYIFAMSIPLGVIISVVRSWWRPLSLFSCAGQILALILTFSRGAWLGSAAALFFLTVISKKWLLIVLLAAFSMASVLNFSSIQDRLASVVRPEDDPSMRDRLQLLRSSLQLGMQNPLLGVGYGRGRLKEALRPYLKGTAIEHTPIWHTHNIYLELLTGTGFLGLLSFLWLLGNTLLKIWLTALSRSGAQRLLGFALAASWIAALVAGLGDIPFYHHETRIFFFTLLAAAHIYLSLGAEDEIVPVASASRGTSVQLPSR